MYSDIKTIFFNAAVQEQISNIVSHTIGIAFDLAYQNENILVSDYEEISANLKRQKYSDVTVLTKFTRMRIEFKDSDRMSKTGNINTIMHSLRSDSTLIVRKKEKLTRQIVQDFCEKFHEMNSLLQILKFHRNQLSHSTKPINEEGWGLSVISSLLRLFEIGIDDKKNYLVQEKIKEQIRKNLDKLFNNKKGDSGFENANEDQQVAPQSEENIEKIVEEIKIELNEIEKRLGKKIESLPSINLSEFNKLIEGQSTILETVQSKVSANENESSKDSKQSLDKEDEIPDEDEDIDYVPSEDTYLTADTLRQELRNLREKIKENYKDDKAFGPKTNLLHLSNIEVIIENEPKNFKEVIRLEGIRTNMDISSEIIKKQMTEYGPKLDRLLSKVLWSSLFS